MVRLYIFKSHGYMLSGLILQAAAPELNIEINDSEESWNNFLNKINNSLNPFDLELKFIVDEVTSVKTWSLVYKVNLTYTYIDPTPSDKYKGRRSGTARV